MTKPTALITGATSGIGEATARILAPTHRLIICGRREDRLATLKSALESATEVHTLAFDVRDREKSGKHTRQPTRRMVYD